MLATPYRVKGGAFFRADRPEPISRFAAMASRRYAADAKIGGICINDNERT